MKNIHTHIKQANPVAQTHTQKHIQTRTHTHTHTHTHTTHTHTNTNTHTHSFHLFFLPRHHSPANPLTTSGIYITPSKAVSFALKRLPRNIIRVL